MPSLDPFPHFAPFWLVFGGEEGRDVGHEWALVLALLFSSDLIALCPTVRLYRSCISEYHLLDSTCEMTESAVTTILSRSHSFQAHEAHTCLGACRLRFTVGRAPIWARWPGSKSQLCHIFIMWTEQITKHLCVQISPSVKWEVMLIPTLSGCCKN